MTASAAIGLAFCGIVDEAPRSGPPRSRTSPTSVRDRSTTSRANRTQVPATVVHVRPKRTTRSRATCHGTSAPFRPSLDASAARTCTERDPLAALVPPAPNRDTTRASSRTLRTSPTCRVTSARKTAILAPKVVGTACWAWVRAAMTVPAWSSVRDASALPKLTRRSTNRSPERPSWRLSAVSMTSCVVAPWCTRPAGPDGSAARIIRTSGWIG